MWQFKSQREETYLPVRDLESVISPSELILHCGRAELNQESGFPIIDFVIMPLEIKRNPQTVTE